MKIARKFDAFNASENAWNPVSGFGFAAYCVCAAVVLLITHTGEGWVPLLDSANLAFHEAGHPIFGLLSNTLTVYGGTLGQLVFPIAAAVSFRQKYQTLSFGFALLWFAENLFNIARYMADARSRILPLVGNGEHDWTEIFTRWNVLESDTLIAGFVRVLGWLLIIAVGVWLWNRHQEN